MRILIIGAGVTGSLFASSLAGSRDKLERVFKESIDIRVLARGETFQRLSENGLKIQHVVQEITTIDSIPVVKTLESGDIYDFVLVFLRKTQVSDLMEDLKSNRSGYFVFAGNNGRAFENICPPLKKQRVSLAFASVGGKREGDTVFSVHGKKPLITVGANKTTIKKIRLLKRIMRIAGCSLKISWSMESWLNHHLALVLPLALALYRDGGDNISLSQNNGLMKNTVKAIKEGSSALRRLGHPVRPGKLRLSLLMPDFIIKRKLTVLLGSPMGKLLIYDHCMAAPEEMKELANELRTAIRGDEKPRPNLEYLLDQNN